MSSPSFSEKEDIYLIQSVENYPSIYDKKCSLYKTRYVAENAFLEIAKVMNRSGNLKS